MKSGDIVTINLPGSKFDGKRAVIVGTRPCRCCFRIKLVGSSKDDWHGLVEEGCNLVGDVPDEEQEKEAVGV